MNLLATFNDNDFEPKDYIDRPTVKAVIINDNDEVLLFSGGLPGGGVEENETKEMALTRELVDEVWAVVTIVSEIGNVIAYRDSLKLRYVFTVYKCFLVSIVAPVTILGDEVGKLISWEKREDAIIRIENEIAEIKMRDKNTFEEDRYQARIFNREITILFLKQISK